MAMALNRNIISGCAFKISLLEVFFEENEFLMPSFHTYTIIYYTARNDKLTLTS